MDALSEMRRFLDLFHRYIIRDLGRNRARVALTISGVALGIGVVVAVQLANSRAIAGFNQNLRVLSGEADLQIVANGLPLSEQLMKDLGWIWDYGSMSPVLEGRAVVPALNGEAVQVFGVDLLSEAAFRRYVLPDRTNLTTSITRDEFVDLLIDPRRAIVPGALAQRLGLQKDSALEVVIGDRRERFTVG